MPTVLTIRRLAWLPVSLAALLVLTLTATSAAPADRAANESPVGEVLVLGGARAVATTIADQLPACVDAPGRIEGDDRYATAAELARRSEAAGPVYLASGRSFPDALAAVPVVAADDGVLLLTEPDTLPGPTRAELDRRRPERVVVLGGTAAIADAVMDQVVAMGLEAERVGGADRYETAARLASVLPSDARTVVVATGAGFADALAMGPAAARDLTPILLVEPDVVPPATSEVLTRFTPQQILVVGGTVAVSDAVVEAVADQTGLQPRRLAGADRHATAAVVAAATWPAPTGTVTLATGRDFADALAAGPVLQAPLLLVDRDLSVAAASELVRHTTDRCRVLVVRPDEVEGLTLGPSSAGGSTLTVTVDDGAVVLDAPDDTGGLLRAHGSGDATAALSYPAPASGSPAVAWSQPLTADAEELLARQPWRGQRPPPADGITLAWQYTGDSDRYRDEVAAAPGLTVTAPFRYYLDTGGNLVGRADPAFVADMHGRGVDVWPTIHTCGATCVAAALTDPARRSAHARAIAADALAVGADGVNIDIEGFHDSERDAVTAFVEELSALVQPEGLVTSYDFTVMTDTWHTPPAEYAFWSTAPDRRAISDAVDYAVLMAYDEHNRFRPKGPVASPGWVEEALRFQLRYADPDRVLLGVPLYGRVWSGDVPTHVGIGTIEQHVRDGRVEPDPRFGIDRVTLPDGRVTWAETVAGLQHRVDLVDQYGLAGTASWRLGFDSPAVWTVLP